MGLFPLYISAALSMAVISHLTTFCAYLTAILFFCHSWDRQTILKNKSKEWERDYMI